MNDPPQQSHHITEYGNKSLYSFIDDETICEVQDPVECAELAWSQGVDAQTHLVKLVMDKIRTEMKTLSKNKDTKFVLQSPSDLKSPLFYKELYTEISNYLPTVLMFAEAVCLNIKQLAKNKCKTELYLKFQILQAIGVLVKGYNRNLNSMAKLNAIILRRGGLEKSAFVRMSRSGFSIEYAGVLRLQLALGDNHDAEALQWKKEIEGQLDLTPTFIEAQTVFTKNIQRHHPLFTLHHHQHRCQGYF